MPVLALQSSPQRKKHRIGKKLKAVEVSFSKLPRKHRTRETFLCIAEAHGLSHDKAHEHFRLALAVLEGGE